MIRRLLRQWREKVDGTLVGPAMETDGATIDQSQSWGRTTVSSDTTTDGTSIYWYVDTSGGAVTLTLASDDAEDGREINVKRDGANDVTVTTEASETIDGDSSIVLTQDQEAVTLVFNDTESDWGVW